MKLSGHDRRYILLLRTLFNNLCVIHVFCTNYHSWFSGGVRWRLVLLYFLCFSQFRPGVLLEHVPKLYQTLLMSATLSDDVLKLKSLAMHNPANLKLNETLHTDDNLQQVCLVKLCGVFGEATWCVG